MEYSADNKPIWILNGSLFIYKVTRLEQLKIYLEEDPNDPFNHYALALEYIGTNPEYAQAQLLLTIQTFPDYVPSYYQAANMLLLSGQNELANSMIQNGKIAAARAGDHKALAELNRLESELE